MAASSEMWTAFAKSAAMLLVVIALLLLILYVVRRFSAFRAGSKGKADIMVVAVHHLAPKEKIVLVDVLDQKILLGVTPQTITTLATFDREKHETSPEETSSEEELGFSGFLKKSVGGSKEKMDDHEA